MLKAGPFDDDLMTNSSAMAEAPPKLIYVVPVDDGEPEGRRSFRYTRSVLQSTLHLMGCKARHAFKISRRVFEVIRSKVLAGDPCTDFSQALGASDAYDRLHCKENDTERRGSLNPDSCMAHDNVESNSSVPFELYKRQTTVLVARETFLNAVCDALSEYKYVGPYQKADFTLACRIRERKESVTILLCGTSGCGKSTLSALLGSRLGITTVVSTDSIRHMMRSFVDEKENPLLWASTYHAGECLDPVAVAQAKAKRKAKKLAGPSKLLVKEEVADRYINSYHDVQPLDSANKIEVGKKLMAIEGYKAQSEMVIDSLDRLISAWEDRKESVIVEGVHLSLNFVMGLMKKHPSIIPFMVYIANEDKHMERFAVRVKYMTLDPAKNKYVKYIRNIRTIQEYLSNRAGKHLVPKVNNTNVDKSVAAIHATVFSSLRRREAGEEFYDPATNTVPLIDEEYRKQCAANSMSSKGMFQMIQRQGSSRHLMALLNTDGSVARAWPVKSSNNKEPHLTGDNEDNCKGPIYGPLKIGKAEPVNLQFGTYGISAWTTDTGETSHHGSIDGSAGDCNDIGNRYISRCNSPKTSDGAAKELMDEASTSGSEGEVFEPDDGESNGDQSDIDNKMTEEIEGSVDEGSSKSDEDFEDLAMQDGLENGYCSDDEDKPNKMRNLTGAKKLTLDNPGMMAGNDSSRKYQRNMELSPKRYHTATESSCSYSFLTNGNTTGFDPKAKKPFPVNSRRYGRSLSIPASGKSAS